MSTHTPAEAPLGRILRDGDRTGLRYERTLRHAPDLVWRAITESDHLAAWLPVDIVGERRAGAAVQLPFWPAMIERFGIDDPEQYLAGEIRIWEPITTFEWDWGGDVIRFDLEPVEGGTLLILTAWLGPAPVEAWQAAAGWHMCLGFLSTHLDTGAVAGAASGDPEPFETMYREAFGVAD